MQPYRKERLDRGAKVRTEDIYALASLRDLVYALGPRALAVIALLIAPFLEPLIGVYWMKVLLITLVVSLLAVSWDVLAVAGLPSLGQALFFGVGGYMTGYLNHQFGWPPGVCIPIATVAGAALCTALLTPVLRLRGIYFGLITLALPLVFSRLIEATKILGGTEGLSGLDPLPNFTLELYLGIAAVLFFAFAYRRLIESDYGMVLQGINANDRVVLASGISLTKFKVEAVFLAALPGTLGGALLTHHYQFVGMPAFAMEYSLLPLASAVVGGTGTLVGPVLGAFILTPLSEVLRSFGTLRMVVYAIILVVFAVGVPEGLLRFLQRKYHQFQRVVPVEEVAWSDGSGADLADRRTA
ncbi:MAG: branched-chain amino acid ABC transporter permease [Clostridia bacterium]|nr:branched-chain amino acid ABC transporter permease [Clostridia bacterium]MDH7573098.1 branched-chain amino acid ABC transporter permease [Clostridia bacterium]